MIHAIFFDIDGTLIDTTTHTIPASTLIALKALHTQGYKVAIASGRDYKNMREIKELPLSLFDGIVASNGMCIYDNHGTCMQSHNYSKDSVECLLRYANEHHITLVFETHKDIYTANEINPYVDIANAYYQESTPPNKQWQGEDIIKISCFQRLHYDFSLLEKQAGVTFLPTPTTTYDVTLPEVSKLTGIHTLMELWGFSKSSFMCFGDHDNDIEMMQGASIGVAVMDKLGSKRLQEVADAVCPAASKDGIYTYLKQLGMLKKEACK